MQKLFYATVTLVLPAAEKGLLEGLAEAGFGCSCREQGFCFGVLCFVLEWPLFL